MEKINLPLSRSLEYLGKNLRQERPLQLRVLPPDEQKGVPLTQLFKNRINSVRSTGKSKAILRSYLAQSEASLSFESSPPVSSSGSVSGPDKVEISTPRVESLPPSPEESPVPSPQAWSLEQVEKVLKLTASVKERISQKRELIDTKSGQLQAQNALGGVDQITTILQNALSREGASGASSEDLSEIQSFLPEISKQLESAAKDDFGSSRDALDDGRAYLEGVYTASVAARKWETEDEDLHTLSMSEFKGFQKELKAHHELLERKVPLIDTRSGRTSGKSAMEGVATLITDLDALVALGEPLTENQAHSLKKQVDEALSHLSQAKEDDYGSSRDALQETQKNLSSMGISLHRDLS